MILDSSNSKNESLDPLQNDITGSSPDDYSDDYTEAFWNRQIGILKTSYINTVIIVLNILIFGLCLLFGESVIEKYEQRSEYIVMGYQYYRLVTSMFLHADLEHLFSNMLILFFVGANVEHDLGHLPYVFLYFLSGILGNLTSVAYDVYRSEFTPSIGASGAVFGIIGAVIIIVLYGRKNLRKGSNLMIRLALMVALSVYSGFTAENVDNAAHIGGLVGGVIITFLITLICRKEYTMEEWL